MRLRLGLVALAVVALDQATKIAVDATLAVGESRPVIDGFLYLSHVRNSGAAFGLLRGMTGILVLAALVGVVAFAAVIVRQPPAAVGVGAALVAGGALGNLVDRVARGDVVDFVDVRWWPAWNVADAAISVGAIVFVLAGIREDRAQRSDERAGEDADTTGDGTVADRRPGG